MSVYLMKKVLSDIKSSLLDKIKKDYLSNVEFKDVDPVHSLYLSTEPYRIKKSKEAGEKDLVKIALNTDKEEVSLLYVPSSSYWYNLTEATGEEFLKKIKKTNMEAYAGVCSRPFNGRDLEKLGCNKDDKIRIYHTHPEGAINLYKEFFDKLFSSEERLLNRLEQKHMNFDVFLEILTCTSISTPSGNDIHNCVVRSKRLKNFNIVSKIISPYSVAFNYSLNTLNFSKLKSLMKKFESKPTPLHFRIEDLEVDNLLCGLPNKVKDLKEQYQNLMDFSFYRI